MNPTSRVSSLDVDVHLVLCDFGRAGLAYVETDPTEADATTRDVSEAIAAKVRDVADQEGRDLTAGTLAFIEVHIGRVVQPTLPLW
jgi:hypothetical protein